ncbi:exodeoxyribonuclease V subunit beta [Ideonella margarita]|uniref:RecBCD enzyme subunit RecB n=1 Tax=Ideonella margarita TaxID=2984191 RepID=A0ABU9C6L7_9BURK
MSQPLQALTFPLWGSRLIEASAGTGKTWTIAALYLRLVLGHGGEQAHPTPLRPDQILVMTFTRAATRELSDRIRDRLLQGAKAFRGELPVDELDPFLRDLLAAYADPLEREQAAWRLAMAAEGMDDAAVHTIDAWCQRMLREHAFDSGCLFDETLLADEQALLLEAVQDYWRQQCYPLAAEQLPWVDKAWRNLDGLMRDVRSLIQQPLPEGAGHGSLAACIERAVAERSETLLQLQSGWDARAQSMRQWLTDQLADKKSGWNGRKLQARYFDAWLDTLASFGRGELGEAMPEFSTGRTRLTPAGLMDARKDDAPAVNLPPEFAQFDALVKALDQLTDVSVALRLHAVARVNERLALLKRQDGSFGFADMLHRLDTALQGPQGERLRQRIVQQTPVALVDEFQDTSALQFRLFDALYRTADNAASTTLLLIGDPKQSIYRFRGADIDSYLKARRATEGRHYVLSVNYRSTGPLVDAVNTVFLRAEQRTRDEATGDDPDGAFLFRQPDGQNPLPFVPVGAQGRKEQFICSTGPVPPMSVVWDDQLCSAQVHLQRYAWRCAEQIVDWLNDPACGFERDGDLVRLRPADIAVLVRSGREARAVRRALRERGVASVYLSDRDSVLASPEAADLLRWLRAVAQPTDVRLVRAALATRTVGLSLSELATLAHDDEAFDARCEQLRQLHQVWQTQGVLTLLRQTLHLLDLPAAWLQQLDGERRLTNVLHLAELLQQASTTLDGEQALIRWLAEEVQAAAEGAGASGDEQIVRLESDADLVKVITVHKSKGLEYPVVCMPFAGTFRLDDRRNTPFVLRTTDDGERHLDLQRGKDAMAEARVDSLREDLRLFYVALTRARHALWLGLGALAARNGKTPVNHESAAGLLISGPEPASAEALTAALDSLAVANPGIRVQAAEGHRRFTKLASRAEPPALLPAPVFDAPFDKRWTIASFSSLVRAIGNSPAATGPAMVPRPADDEPGSEVATEVGVPATLAARREAAPVWHRFERGAVAGNFLHDQLEWLAGERFNLQDDAALAERLRRRCERHGRGEQAADVLAWLRAVETTTLPGPGAALNQLSYVLPEMEFWLPAQRLPAAEVDALCTQHLWPGRARPALPARDLHGMLMGFADLVFEHEGRYWVLDYKSNQLGPDGAAYTADALADAMVSHRYDVQAALYLLALHRLLQSRLGEAYVPSQHLGGAVYLFLRGIDGPEQGAITLQPPMDLLASLDELLQHAPTQPEEAA